MQKTIRLICLTIGVLLFCFMAWATISVSEPNYGSVFTSLVFPTFIILIFGPLYPTPQKMARWSQKSKMDLPTDDPAVAMPVLCFFLAANFFYIAWDRYDDPDAPLHRLEKLAYALSGHDGVIGFWAIAGVLLFVSGTVLLRRAKRK